MRVEPGMPLYEPRLLTAQWTDFKEPSLMAGEAVASNRDSLQWCLA